MEVRVRDSEKTATKEGYAIEPQVKGEELPQIEGRRI